MNFDYMTLKIILISIGVFQVACLAISFFYFMASKKFWIFFILISAGFVATVFLVFEANFIENKSVEILSSSEGANKTIKIEDFDKFPNTIKKNYDGYSIEYVVLDSVLLYRIER